MVFVIPEFERLFAEFRLVLPSHTEATIDASRFAVRYWYVVVLFTLFIAYPAIGYVSYHLRHRSNKHGLTRLWFVLILCLPLVMQTLTLLSVLSTESALLTNLSG
jgi:type II secretory pathway component PulF